MFNILLLLLTQPALDFCDCGFTAREFTADTLISRPRWFISYASETPDPFDKGAMRLLELADSFYFASCDTQLSNLCQRETRRAAYALYETILQTFPDSYAEPFVKTALAWRLLEDGFFHEAADEFKSVFYNTADKDVQVISAYGKGLAHFYTGDYETAFTWMLDAEGYRKSLKVAVNEEDADSSIPYSETADSLIDKALLVKAQAAERNQWYGDALDIYRRVTDYYPDRPSAELAWLKIVDFYVQAKEVDKAEAATDDLTHPHGRGRYLEPYKYATALMYDYSIHVLKDTVKAEVYRQVLIKWDSSDVIIEKLYYSKVMEFNDTSDIDDLIEVTDRLRYFNPQSTYLPRPMTLLGLLLAEAERYDEADSVFDEVKGFPDATATLDLLPIVEFQQACIQYRQGKFAGAVVKFEAWLDTHEGSPEVDLNLTAEAYWFLAMTSVKRAEAETIPLVKAEYFGKSMKALETLHEKYSGTTIYKLCFADRIEEIRKDIEVHLH